MFGLEVLLVMLITRFVLPAAVLLVLGERLHTVEGR